VATYSPRPGTIAWRRMADDVPQEVKAERLQAVEELQARIAGEINSALLGRSVEVLVEEESDGRLSGRTRSGKLVHFDKLSAQHFDGGATSGDLVHVVIERTGPWSLQGRPVGAEVATTPGL